MHAVNTSNIGERSALAGAEPVATIGVAMMARSFPRPVGDIGNAATFGFPVAYDTIEQSKRPAWTGAEATRAMLSPILESCMRLVDRGATSLTTSAGYCVLLQQELAASLPVPFVSSPLLQLPMVLRLVPQDKKVGVIVARAESITKDHFVAAGLNEVDLPRVHLIDLRQVISFREAILDSPQNRNLDVDQVAGELSHLCWQIIMSGANIGAFVAECTNVGPYSASIRKTTNLPVWDAVSLVNWLHSTECTSMPPGRLVHDHQKEP